MPAYSLVSCYHILLFHFILLSYFILFCFLLITIRVILRRPLVDVCGRKCIDCISLSLPSCFSQPLIYFVTDISCYLTSNTLYILYFLYFLLRDSSPDLQNYLLPNQYLALRTYNSLQLRYTNLCIFHLCT